MIQTYKIVSYCVLVSALSALIFCVNWLSVVLLLHCTPVKEEWKLVQLHQLRIPISIDVTMDHHHVRWEFCMKLMTVCLKLNVTVIPCKILSHNMYIIHISFITCSIIVCLCKTPHLATWQPRMNTKRGPIFPWNWTHLLMGRMRAILFGWHAKVTTSESKQFYVCTSLIAGHCVLSQKLYTIFPFYKKNNLWLSD